MTPPPVETRSRLTLWLTVILYVGGAAIVAAVLTLAATAIAPEAIGDRGLVTRTIDGLVHALVGAAFGAAAIGRLRRDGDASGGSRVAAAGWIGLTLGAGAFGGGTLVDVMEWSRRAESGLPAILTLASGAVGAWLTILTARLAPPLPAPPPPVAVPPLAPELRRFAFDAMDALDQAHASLAALAARPAARPIAPAEARAAFASADELARLCGKLSGTAVCGSLLEAGMSAIDALRVAIVARGWSSAIEVADPEAYLHTVAARYGLRDAPPAAVAAAVRDAAERHRALARASVAAATGASAGVASPVP